MFGLHHNVRLAALLAFCGFAAFSFSDAITRVLVHRDLGVFTVAAITQSFAVLFLLAAHKPLGHVESLFKSKHKKLHVVRAILFCISMPLNVYAFSVLPFTLVYSLLFTGSLWAIFFSGLITGEHIAVQRITAVITGLCGAFIVLRPWEADFDWRMCMPLLSAMCYGVRSLMDRKLGATETPLAMAVMSSFLAVPIILVMATATGTLHIPQSDDWILFAIGGLCMAIGMLCIPMAFRYAQITVVGPFHYTQLLWGAFIGFFFFQQVPDIWTFAGGLIIVGSGLSVVLRAPQNLVKA